uniref:Uncharacterized protein n=1 Tax=Arundo donax TaxID=35708 RepID=A0A0A9A8R3_ARUDO
MNRSVGDDVCTINLTGSSQLPLSPIVCARVQIIFVSLLAAFVGIFLVDHLIGISSLVLL